MLFEFTTRERGEGKREDLNSDFDRLTGSKIIIIESNLAIFSPEKINNK